MSYHQEISFDAVIPSAMLLDDSLEPAAIKLYAIIRSLTRLYGYCYATNGYLADLIKVDESTIKRWMLSLNKGGYVEIETDKEGVHWKRKIYISEIFKKKLRRLENELPPSQKCAPPSSKMSYILEEELKEEKKKSRKAAAPPPITLNNQKKKFEGVTEEDIKLWQDTFPAVNIRKELAEAFLWALNAPRKNYRKSINTWMRNVNEKHTTPFKTQNTPQSQNASADDSKENKKRAMEWEDQYDKGSHYGVEAGTSKVTFLLPENHGYSVEYANSKEEFEKLCRRAISRMRKKPS